MWSSGKETLGGKKKTQKQTTKKCSCHFNSLLAWIVQCQVKAQESHKAHLGFNTPPVLVGQGQRDSIMARGLRGEREQKGKKEDDL